jgi:uncharacterized protein
MSVLRTLTYFIKKLEVFFIYRVLHVNDTPHRIALSIAIAVFWTWTPTIGLQMVLTLATATLLRANKFVGLPFVWISNPATIIPLYVPNYFVGCWITGGDYSGWTVIRNATTEAFALEGGMWEHFVRIGNWFQAITPVFLELWVGSVVVGLALAVLSYFGLYRMIVVYRSKYHNWQARHAERKAERKEKREEKRQDNQPSASS